MGGGPSGICGLVAVLLGLQLDCLARPVHAGLPVFNLKIRAQCAHSALNLKIRAQCAAVRPTVTAGWGVQAGGDMPVPQGRAQQAAASGWSISGEARPAAGRSDGWSAAIHRSAELPPGRLGCAVRSSDGRTGPSDRPYTWNPATVTLPHTGIYRVVLSITQVILS